MDLIVTGVVAGVLGTLVMDSLNHLFARTGMLSKIDMGMIGRMSAGWARGRFGVGLAVTYVLGWDLLVGGPASPVWALAYGVATTVASHFFVFPSMGLGVFGRRSPEGIRAPLSSLANHLFYGVGMAVAVALA
jgi:uncharacterized membrane protein YeaQ/YmgE (transglycosylase-associated protein family)